MESNYKVDAVSPDKKDYGLMQIRSKYVKETPAQLFDTCTNIRVGTEKLAEARKMCKHKKDYTYVVCYNAGVTGGSKIKHPTNFPYYKKVMKARSKYVKNE